MNPFEPNAKPAPEGNIFGIAELYLFPVLTRALHRQLTGEQAPPWDPEKPIKRWADKTEGQPFYTYPFWEVVGQNVVFSENTIPRDWAATVNLPGQYDYPKWEPSEVRGALVSDISRSEINPLYVTTAAQAQFIAYFFPGASVTMQEYPNSPFRFEFEPGEDRRVYLIVIGGTANVAGLLLREQYRDGEGAPGTWILGPEGKPQWLSEALDISESYDATPEVPIPCRALYPGEVVELGISGLRVRKQATAPTEDELLRSIYAVARRIETKVNTL